MRNNYRIMITFDTGFKTMKDCVAFDFGVSFEGYLTLYFGNRGRIIIDIRNIKSYQVECIYEGLLDIRQ